MIYHLGHLQKNAEGFESKYHLCNWLDTDLKNVIQLAGISEKGTTSIMEILSKVAKVRKMLSLRTF